jgi:hypothetical protein
MEQSAETATMNLPSDNRTCEFIASLPEDILAQFILQSPTPDFAEPFDLHAIGCVTCARKIHAAAGSYLKKHPELALPEKVEQLRQVVLDRTKRSE